MKRKKQTRHEIDSPIAGWGIHLNPVLRIMAIEAASGAEAITGLAKFVHDRTTRCKFPKPPCSPTWFRLYRQPKRVAYTVIDALIAPTIPEERLSLFLRLLHFYYRRWGKLPVDQRQTQLQAALREIPQKEFGRFMKVMAAILQRLQRFQIAKLQDDDPISDSDRAKFEARYWPMPEVQFLIRIYFPCYLLYQDFPGRLMVKARKGDLDAICKLLALDPSLIAEERIAEHFAKAADDADPLRQQQMLAAISGGWKVPSDTFVKSALMGYISKVSRVFGQPLTGPEISELFDAVAQTSGKQTPDPHIPVGEALTKSIQRGRAAWRMIPDLPNRTKKRPHRVR